MMPEDIIEDKPLKIKDWQPENHDGEYYGDITLRNAFAKSLNVATVRLAREIGIKNVIKTAQKAGLTTPIENDLSIALGTSSVKLIDIHKYIPR